MKQMVLAGAVAQSSRFAAAANSFTAVLFFGVVLLLLLIIGYHIMLDSRARSRAALRRKVQQAVQEELAAGAEKNAGRVIIAGKAKLFTRRGLAVVAQEFDAADTAHRTALRAILLRMGLGSFLIKELKTDNEDYLVELVRLVGDMDLVGLDTRITALLYAYRSNIDLQYQCFFTLSVLGSFEPLVRVCMDESYVHTLSFRSLQEILTAFTGDRAALYETLLAAPDHYVVRSCIKRIGTEDLQALAPKVMPWMDSEDHNLIIDAVRTLGQLHHQPATDKIARLLGHPRWEVRSIAATALATIDRDGNEDALIKALQDSEWQVRYNAGAALRTSPNIPAIRQKVEASQDKYAMEMLQYMIETEAIWRRAQ